MTDSNSTTTAHTTTAKKILIIEDEQELFAVLEDKFKTEGFSVEGAHDGKTGFDKAIAQEPDLILLDIKLPKMDGTEVLRRLREESEWGAQVPIIILSNMASEDMQSHIHKYEPAHYLVKAGTPLHEVIDKVKARLEM